MSNDDDYTKYRGKCRELSELAVSQDPSLTLVRGHYDCPIWGLQQHWWCQYQDGTIHDPTKDQFPSKGLGEYIPFDGMCSCEQCGKKIKEEDATIDGHHVFCSDRCYGLCVGFNFATGTFTDTF